jgi:tRNA(Ile)-lysidine synthase
VFGAVLNALRADRGPVLVAWSGGLDSTVLLHATVAAGRELGVPVSAIHIAHGLQAAAEAWPAHCRQLADALGVPLAVVALPPAQPVGQGLEAWARRERYAAIAAEAARLGAQRVLVAHHADDQAETVLLRLARGAGLRGLAAMASERPLGSARLLRPLLGLPRSTLAAYARAHALAWIDDPSNADARHARNRVRLEVLPALARAVPGAPANIARAAALAADAQAVLDEVAAADLAQARSLAGASLATAPAGIVAVLAGVTPGLALHRGALTPLSAARQRLALRAWIDAAGGAMPALAVIEEARRQLLAARAAQGRVELDELALCRYRDWLWIEPLRPAPALQAAQLRWSGEAQLPAAGGWLIVAPAAPGHPGAIADAALRAGVLRVEGLPSSLRVRLRPGGVSRTLKHWHQAMGVPARLRPGLPGIRLEGRLVHAAGLGDVWEREAGGSGARPAAVAPSVAPSVAPPAPVAADGHRRWRLRWEPADADDARWSICALQQDRVERV